MKEKIKLQKIDSKAQKAWWEAGLRMFVQLSGWIVFPIVIAIYLGRWLDNKYDKEPWLYLLCVGVAFVVTNVGIVKVAVQTMKQISQESSKEQIKKSSVEKKDSIKADEKK